VPKYGNAVTCKALHAGETMTPSKWDRAKDIFEMALKRYGSEREEFIRHACAGDDAVRDQVWTFIKGHEAAGSTVLERTRGDSDRMQRFLPGNLIAKRFRIVSFIGHGGMGEVYEAEDLELNDRVALKTIRTAIANSARAMARFRQEIQLARKVTHPNVCRVFDLFTTEETIGTPPIAFLTMEFLKGETLLEMIHGQGKLKPEQARPIAEQLCAGLGAAHAAGIIHRDFKSSNIMLVSDADRRPRAVVTDFGLARNLMPNNASREQLTQTGNVVGTPAYMAPEQLEGGAITPATDVYALGVVLYEMLTGSRPPTVRTPLTGTNNGKRTPAYWDTTISRCLEHDPEKRFQSAGEVADALRHPPRAQHSSLWYSVKIGWIGVLILFVIFLAFLFIRNRGSARIPAEKHIAVLPLRNITNDPANDAFSEGLSETLTSKLSQMQQFQKAFWVVPASDVRRMSNADAVYRALDASLVITGSIQKIGATLRLTLNLVDAASRRVLASRQVDAGPNELAALQDRVWERVADMLNVQLRPEQRARLLADGTRVPGAFEYHGQGLGYLQRRTAEDFDRAIDLFSKALTIDPSYAAAYASLAEAYSKKYSLTQDARLIPLVKLNVQKALRLNDGLASVHLAAGVMYYQTGNRDDAVRELRRTLQLDPNAADAYYWLGRSLDDMGRTSEAEAAYRTLINQRPAYWNGYSGLAYLYYRHGEYAKAVPPYQTIIELAPDLPLGYENLGGVYVQLGRYDDAIAVLEKSISLKPTSPAYSNLATCYFARRRYLEAVPLLQKAVALNKKDHRIWRNLGDALSLAGDSTNSREAYAEAARLVKSQIEVEPRSPSLWIRLALYSAKMGLVDKARSSAVRALMLSGADADTQFNAALVYAVLNDETQAIEHLKTALDRGYSVAQITNSPELDKLRSRPRYQSVVSSRK
jgi:serine/threonine protein kinase/tetratricopeptide (TPR) repeat protein